MNYKCDKCNGTGTRITRNDSVILDSRYRVPLPPDSRCKKCSGKGSLNWIENIFGKNPPSVERCRFLFNQHIPSNEWSIIHNSNFKPVKNITVYNDNNLIEFPDNISINHYYIHISFSHDVSGHVVIDY